MIRIDGAPPTPSDEGPKNAPGGATPRPVPRRYELPFVDSHPETPSTVTFRFSTDGTGFHYLSNQAVRLVLPGVDDPVQAQPGRSRSPPVRRRPATSRSRAR